MCCHSPETSDRAPNHIKPGQFITSMPSELATPEEMRCSKRVGHCASECQETEDLFPRRGVTRHATAVRAAAVPAAGQRA